MLQFDSAEAARQLYRMHLRHVNLEFAAGVTDAGLLTLRGCALDSLNLNACQQCVGCIPSPLASYTRHPYQNCLEVLLAVTACPHDLPARVC